MGSSRRGADVPVSVGFNILWPESAEVAVRTTAVLRSIRGGDELGRYEPAIEKWSRPTGVSHRPGSGACERPVLKGPMCSKSSASWVSTGVREGSVLGRLIRRRWPAAVPNSAVRRVVFTVVDPAAKVAVARTRWPRPRNRSRLDRSDAVAQLSAVGRRGDRPAAEPGRFAWAVPPEALIEPSRPRSAAGLDQRTGAEASKLDAGQRIGPGLVGDGAEGRSSRAASPAHAQGQRGRAGGTGRGPDRAGGGGPGSSPRLLLDACAPDSPILQDGPPATFNWLVWPSTAEMVLVLLNRSSEAEVRLGMVTLTELDELPRAVSPGRAAVDGCSNVRAVPERTESPGSLRWRVPRARRPRPRPKTWRDIWVIAAPSAVVLPEQLADRSMRRALDGQADEDSTGPDRLEVIRRVLARQGLSLWLELDFTGPGALPGLPRADSPEAARRGLVRVDRQGRPDGPEYHPLHPEVREAMKRRVIQALLASTARPGRGKRQRGSVDPAGARSDVAGNAGHRTRRRHIRSIRTRVVQPGDRTRHSRARETTDPDRFAVRARYLAGVGRMPWLAWRSRAIASLYTELAEAAQAAVPGSVLAVVTPGLDEWSGRRRGAAGRSSRTGSQPGVAQRRARSPSLAEHPGRASGVPRGRALRRTRWGTTWPPAQTSTRWSPVGLTAACS